jgi:hypothetical protein
MEPRASHVPGEFFNLAISTQMRCACSHRSDVKSAWYTDWRVYSWKRLSLRHPPFFPCAFMWHSHCSDEREHFGVSSFCKNSSAVILDPCTGASFDLSHVKLPVCNVVSLAIRVSWEFRENTYILSTISADLEFNLHHFRRLLGVAVTFIYPTFLPHNILVTSH